MTSSDSADPAGQEFDAALAETDGGTAAATSLAPQPPQGPPPCDASQSPLYCVYTVQPGDTLFAIALANGVTVESLQFANALEGDVIFPGQVLIIPSGTVAPPTPVISPTPPEFLTVVSFTASPNPVDRGQELTLSWDVAFALKITVWPMTYDRKTGRWSRLDEDAGPDPMGLPHTSNDASGQWTGRVPDDARYPLRFEVEAFDDQGARVIGSSEVVALRCYPSIASGGYCPLAPATIDAAYQSFELGYLIWRADTDHILVISANPAYYLPWSLEASTPRVRPIPAPPAGRLPPGWRFAGLWSSFDVTVPSVGAATPELRTLALSELLGWATGPQVEYEMRAQIDLDNTQSGILNDRLFVSLPDGRLAALILYDGAQGATGPAWSFVEP